MNTSHQVLARKWRPRDFDSLIGQDMVVRALRHALDQGRLHHAYLLTGTRGVGKTTIARILAKAVNCETGLSSRPCGQCSACRGVDVGRFPDYVEMDAASNRRVEEMAVVLENAAYAPAAGRYKVFVIDEVHMLSNHAFNAMLKTLEEPPEHVIFVLATTDPQKVPLTVLSRCLQLGLRNLSPDAIATHLTHVLGVEEIPFEAAALPVIGRAAAGSMRDALSLLDQAIAMGGGQITAEQVRQMLGVVDERLADRLLEHLVLRDASAVLALADESSAQGVSAVDLLLALAERLQRAAVVQCLQRDRLRRQGRGGPELDVQDTGAGALDPEDVQVWYQIAIQGARDVPLAPDPLGGLVMTLVRMLAFLPDAGPGRAPPPAADRGGESPRGSPGAPQPAAPIPARVQAPEGPRSAGGAKPERPLSSAADRAEPRVPSASARPVGAVAEPSGRTPALRAEDPADGGGDGFDRIARPAAAVCATATGIARPVTTGAGSGAVSGARDGPVPGPERMATLRPVQPQGPVAPIRPAAAAEPDALAERPAAAPLAAAPEWPRDRPMTPAEWAALAGQIVATGLVRQFLNQSELLGCDTHSLQLRVPIPQLAESGLVTRAGEAIARAGGGQWQLQVEVGQTGSNTGVDLDRRARERRQSLAENALRDDPFVRSAVQKLGASILPDSIQPIEGERP